MCGIVGVISMSDKEVSSYMQEFFEDMLYMDAIRGPHSTGVMMAGSNGSTRMCKAAAPACDFLYSNGYMKFKKQAKTARAIIGHNRWATVGNVTNKNAHPFVFNNIMMVHNGTLRDHDKLDHKVEVDSEALTREVQIHGYEDALNKIDGDYALSWFNNQDKTLNFIRNYNRPLTFAHALVYGERYLLLASEGMMLEWLIHRSRGIFLEGKVTDFKANTLFKFQYDENFGGKPVVTETPFQKKYPRYNGIYQGGYYGWGDDTYITGTDQASTVQEETKRILRQNRRATAATVTPIAKSLVGKRVLLVADAFFPYKHGADKGRMEWYPIPYQPDLTDDQMRDLRDHDVVSFSVALESFEKRYSDKSKIYEGVIKSQYPVLGQREEKNMAILDENELVYQTDMWFSDADDDVFDCKDTDCLAPLVKATPIPDKRTLLVQADGTVIVADSEVPCATCGTKFKVKDITDGDWSSTGAYYCQKCDDEADAKWNNYHQELNGYTGGNLI